MKLYNIRVFVRDWDTACEFYEHTLKLPLKYKNPQLGWAEFDVGGPSLGIERVDNDDREGQELVGQFLGISLQIDDIASTYKHLTDRGVEFTQPPEQQPWGGRLTHFRDPAGNVLTLLE